MFESRDNSGFELSRESFSPEAGQCKKGRAFEIGQRVLRTNGMVIVGLSIGNSYYNKKNIEALLGFLGQYASNIELFIPEGPAQHTYRALGYNEIEATRKCRLNANTIRNHYSEILARSSDLENETNEIDWECKVACDPEYLKRLKEIELLYDLHLDFYRDVRQATSEVLAHKRREAPISEDSIDIGVKFLLEELAFLLAAPKIFDSTNIAYVYHKDWGIFEKLIEGCYGSGFSDSGIGFIVVNETGESSESDTPRI